LTNRSFAAATEISSSLFWHFSRIFIMLENCQVLSELCLKTVKSVHFDKLFFAAFRKIIKNKRFSRLFSLFSANIIKVENPVFNTN